MSIEQLLSRLQSVEWRGNRGYARCPAHEDQHRSLSLGVGRDGQGLVKCHAGCTLEEVLKAVDMEVKDLWPTQEEKLPDWLEKLRPRDEGGAQAFYDYVDENGTLLYQVIRFPDKQFRQRRLEGPVWVWNLNGVRRVLYRLPELIAAPPDDPIVICEGEKDVENLIAIGCRATTGPGGAGKWSAEFGDFLKGRDVVIIPDNDKPGRVHAELVSSALLGVARSIRVVELPGLPEHGDVSDWLAQHPDDPLMALAAIIAATEEREPESKARDFWWANELQATKLPATSWLIHGLLPEGLTVLYGAPKVGKSWLALNLATSIATEGALALGHYYAPDRKVVIVSYEDHENAVRERLAAHLGDRLWPSRLGLRFRLPKADKGGFEWLEQICDENPDIGMIVLDTLQLFRPTRNGSNGRLYAEDVEDMAQMSQFAKSRHLGLVATHHVRKTPSDDPIYKGSGTLGIPAGADTNWFMERTSEGDIIQAKVDIRGRHPGEQELHLTWDADHCCWIAAGESTGGTGAVDRGILSFLATSTDPSWPQDIADAIASPVITVKRHLYALLSAGRVVRLGRKYAIVPPASDDSVEEETSDQPSEAGFDL